MRVVLTGGPHCGKSTMVDLIRGIGYDIIEESARPIIERRRKENKGEAGDFESLQIEIAVEQLKRERSYKSNGYLFLDRSIVDVYAYSEVLIGRVPEKVLELGHNGRYDKVLLLDLLPFKDDGLRIEKDDKEAQRIHIKLDKTYRDFGYNPIRIPVMKDAKTRAEYILKILGLKGGAD